MGRKLELNDLSDGEQANILQVIQRDYALRKKETQRLDKLQRDPAIKKREKKSTKCIVCGSSFLWLFNNKTECNICHCFFCEEKLTCGYQDSNSFEWVCDLCRKEREMQLHSVDWFYCAVKKKFRRHGGAKVLKELYKRKKQEKALSEESDNKEISALELDQLLENSLKKILEQQQQISHCKADDELLWRYLKDHKQYLIRRILKEIIPVQKTSSSSKMNTSSPMLCNAETMTEISDGELDFTFSRSGSLQSGSSVNHPTQRLQSLRTRSLCSSVNVEQSGGTLQQVVQGVLVQKETVPGSDANTAFSEAFGDSEFLVRDKHHMIATELKFTAADGLYEKSCETRNSTNFFEIAQQNDEDDNWSIVSLKPKTRKFQKKNTYLPPENGSSAYDEVKNQTTTQNHFQDKDEIQDGFIEAEILPVTIKRDFSEVSARSLCSNEVEYIIPHPLREKRRTEKQEAIKKLAQAMSVNIADKDNLQAIYAKQALPNKLLNQTIEESEIRATDSKQTDTSKVENSIFTDVKSKSQIFSKNAKYLSASSPAILHKNFGRCSKSLPYFVNQNAKADNQTDILPLKRILTAEDILEEEFIKFYQKKSKEIQSNETVPQEVETKRNSFDQKNANQGCFPLNSDAQETSVSSEEISVSGSDDNMSLSLSTTTTNESFDETVNEPKSNLYAGCELDEVDSKVQLPKAYNFGQSKKFSLHGSSLPSLDDVEKNSACNLVKVQNISNAQIPKLSNEQESSVDENLNLRSSKSIKKLVEELNSAGLRSNQIKFKENVTTFQSSKSPERNNEKDPTEPNKVTLNFNKQLPIFTKTVLSSNTNKSNSQKSLTNSLKKENVFIRSSPVRGSLTMRGSRIKSSSDHSKEKASTTASVEENIKNIIPESLVFTIKHISGKK